MGTICIQIEFFFRNTRIYKTHKNSSEKALKKLLVKKGLINHLPIASLFSVFAAYNVREVTDALEERGFYCRIDIVRDESRYIIEAIMPTIQERIIGNLYAAKQYLPRFLQRRDGQV